MWELYEQVLGRDCDPVDDEQDDMDVEALMVGVENIWEPFAAFSRKVTRTGSISEAFSQNCETVVMWRRRAG